MAFGLGRYGLGLRNIASAIINGGLQTPRAAALMAAAAGMGMLIPPSILLIVWAILTEMSVGALFVAGGVPGDRVRVRVAAAASPASTWRRRSARHYVRT